MDLGIAGMTALVTGGSRGIGFAVAHRLALEGCNVHLASRSAQDLDTARAKILAASKVQVTCHALDLSQSASVDRLAADCGNLDILINNAGAIPQGDLIAVDEKRWREAWELKVFGYINLTRAIYANMKEQKHGVIVNVIGTAGERPAATYIAGTAGNAALMAFSRGLGGESVDYGVRVLGVNPGSTETERARSRLENVAQEKLGDASRWRELTKDAPFGRIATADEVADVIVFMASARASYVSGTIVTVDGGRTVRNRTA
ncbi:MAG: short-chain dehydrogenase [Betaproteobacteria bacterium]|nr:short-chain dehydrogenase [Betaproteobacteria bacterium]